MGFLETIQQCEPTDGKSMEAAKKRWDSIAKPLHSLGMLEDYIIRIAGIEGRNDVDISKKALIVMCADNGIVEEGVTQTGQEVTAIVAENFLSKRATASILCAQTGAQIFPVDIGMVVDTKVPSRKVGYGTHNFVKEPAMSREEAIQAIETGIQMVRELKEQGFTLLATGEMGIGNTTTSSAVASVLLGEPVDRMTGRGAGLSSEGLKKKIQVIETAIHKYHLTKEDPLDVLAKVGGFDIAGMAGVFLGGALYKIPVVIDGFIASVAALVAARIQPLAAEYMLPSHVSEEPAAGLLLEALGLEPLLHAHMCLGEGTGAVTLFPFLDMAAAVYSQMTTFSDIEIDDYVPLD
ncbi:MAG: nicotinate-nucleotide--dimethylbenzimidazole phosphoribosyltransferase [Lachnospiraceae bacterium]